MSQGNLPDINNYLLKIHEIWYHSFNWFNNVHKMTWYRSSPEHGETLSRTAAVLCPASWDHSLLFQVGAPSSYADFSTPDYIPIPTYTSTFTVITTRERWELTGRPMIILLLLFLLLLLRLFLLFPSSPTFSPTNTMKSIRTMMTMKRWKPTPIPLTMIPLVIGISRLVVGNVAAIVVVVKIMTWSFICF